MDNVRFALLCAFGVVVFLLWQAWLDDHGAREQFADQHREQPAEPAPKTVGDVVPGMERAPARTGRDQAAQPAPAGESGAAVPTPAAAPTPAGEARTARQALPAGEFVHVYTDKLHVVIDTQGGNLRRVVLRDIARVNDDAPPDRHLRLLNASLPNFFITQGGLISAGRSAPDHRDSYSAARREYHLADGRDILEVPLTWTAPDGRRVTKIYTFHRGSYRVGLSYRVVNGSSEPWVVSPYLRFWRVPYERAQRAPFASSFSGIGLYQAQTGGEEYSYHTMEPDSLGQDPLDVQQRGGWIAAVQPYFLAAVMPGPEERVRYVAEPKPVPGAGGQGYISGYIGARRTVPAGETAVLTASLFLGPKLQDTLDDVAPGLELTVDYGIFTIVAQPIFWVLEKLHDLVGNWGVAIILLTVIIKLLFYKLSETQYRAMARMRKFAPRIKQLKEQYGDDKQKLQEKMMELYKTEGFNPLGGCWPLLVQAPVFIALYWVLRGSVELRNADFILWIDDLASPDPYYILPVLFGVTMYLQQRLSSPTMTMDPMQQRMMQIMPIGLAVFFAFFPAGLVLYWLTNNLLSIAQQWYIYRKLDHEGAGSRASAK